MNLWLDDVRPMPADFDRWTTTAAEAIACLSTREVKCVSLDHDLGDEANGSGYDVARWIEERAFAWSQRETGGLPPVQWRLHSQNVVGLANMRRALENADRYWAARADAAASPE